MTYYEKKVNSRQDRKQWKPIGNSRDSRSSHRFSLDQKEQLHEEACIPLHVSQLYFVNKSTCRVLGNKEPASGN